MAKATAKQTIVLELEESEAEFIASLLNMVMEDDDGLVSALDSVLADECVDEDNFTFEWDEEACMLKVL